MANVTKAEKTWLLAGERLRKLRNERGMNQAELAELLPLDSRGRLRSEKTIGRMERGECRISDEYAIMLSRVLGCRYQYLLMQDDFKTEEDRFASLLDGLADNANVLHSLIKKVAANNRYEIKFLPADTKTEAGLSLGGDCYAIIEAGTVIACVSLEEYSQLRSEIAHYSAYLFNNLLQKSKARMIRPFNYPEEVD